MGRKQVKLLLSLFFFKGDGNVLKKEGGMEQKCSGKQISRDNNGGGRWGDGEVRQKKQPKSYNWKTTEEVMVAEEEEEEERFFFFVLSLFSWQTKVRDKENQIKAPLYHK